MGIKEVKEVKRGLLCYVKVFSLNCLGNRYLWKNFKQKMVGTCVCFRRMRYNKELLEGRQWRQNKMLDGRSPPKMRIGSESKVWADEPKGVGEVMYHC